MSQSEIAKSAHIAPTTVADFENGTRVPNFNYLKAIRDVLDAAGIELISDSGGGSGARLRAAPKTDASESQAISREQCRAARAALNLSQKDLAQAAGVGRSTVADFERGARTPSAANLDALLNALVAAGATFIDPNGGGPGVRLQE